MPRNVRNFWLTAVIDGKKARLTGGPRSKDGGFNLTVRMRDNGSIVSPVTIDGIPRSDGTLLLRVNFTGSRALESHWCADDVEIVTSR